MNLKYTTENFNPDCMDQDDLRAWIRFLPRHLALQTLGITAEQRDLALAYCKEKYVAMSCRLIGDIPRALSHERNCSQIYGFITDPMRW